MKSAARKKAAKKSSKKMVNKKPANCEHTVTVSNQVVKPKTLKIKPGEGVCWKYTGTRARKIVFKAGKKWPFGGAKRAITLKPNHYTKSLRVSTKAPKDHFSYRVRPFPGPPNGPAVDVE